MRPHWVRPGRQTRPTSDAEMRPRNGNAIPTAKDGYPFKNKTFLAHRVIWMLKTGEWPTLTVDHINLDRADNRWLNLRLATHAQNCANQTVRRTNRSGLKGAYWHKAANAWVACFRGKYLGLYATKEAAHAAYVAAAEPYFGNFARAS